MVELSVELFEHLLTGSLSLDMILLNLQCGGDFTFLGLHKGVLTTDIPTTTNYQMSCGFLVNKMIQFLQGKSNKQITTATQTVDRKGKVMAMEHNMPWHASHNGSDDVDDDDDDGDCARHNDDNGHDHDH